MSGRLYRATVYEPLGRVHHVYRAHERRSDELVAIYARVADGWIDVFPEMLRTDRWDAIAVAATLEARP